MPDLRYALRSLLKSPGFTAVTILTLALGVGANTAVFSLINSVLLRPLPYEQPDQLVLVWESAPFFGLRDSPVAPANYADWKTRSRSFEEIGALEDCGYRLSGEGEPEAVNGGAVTASFLRALRTRPLQGRIFRDDEDRPGAPKVALISEGFRRRRFGDAAQVIGKTLRLSGEQYTIIGVLAPGTEPPAEYRSELAEIWTPLGNEYTAQELANRGRHNWMVLARLRPGVSLSEADAEMRAIGASLAREFPDTNEKVGAFVAPLRSHFVDSSRRVLLILLGTVAFVLLIACANLANLLLSRAANRSKEVAVRTALGARAWQLARQFLCESLLLCTAGAALGLWLASMTSGFLAHLAPSRISGLNELSVDWRVLGFTLAIAVTTTVLFGLVPLFQIRRADIGNGLKQSARTLAAATGSRRVRALLICSEVALAFVLLIGAGLLMQTFMHLRGVNVGFRTENLLTLRIPSDQHRKPGKSAAYQRELLRRVTAIPGVASAGFTNHIPLADKGDITGIGAEGRGDRERFQVCSRVAGPGYIQTMGMRVTRGRDIDERDGEDAPRVVLINETLASTLWPGQDPIGRRIRFRTDLMVPVVGVVADIHQAGLDVPPKPEFYVSALQAGFFPGSLAIHTKVGPASIVPAVRRAIWSVDRDQPITDLATMDEILGGELLQRRVQTTLLGAFAALALLLACVGLYGVLAQMVGRQIPEIGLRIALGAQPSGILRRVVGHGIKMAVIGVGLGIAGALAVSRLLATVLFEVKHTDPATYAVVAIVLLSTAAIASYVPARRAMQVDPILALRNE